MRFAVYVLSICLVALSTPNISAAQSSDAALIEAEISVLLKQIAKLQLRLQALSAVDSRSSEDRSLLRAETVASNIKAFAREVYGPQLLENLDQIRVVTDPGSDLDALVEAEEGEIILTLNQAVFDLARPAERELLEMTLVHEYAHVLLLTYPEILENFSDKFWYEADRLHAARVTVLPPDARFELTNAYYEDHKWRFVSDYATLSPAEDIAESFTALVYGDAVTPFVHTKVKFLQGYEAMNDAAKILRGRL